MSHLSALFCLLLIFSVEGFLYHQSSKNLKVSFSSSHNEDPGSPLFLSPYIASGRIEEAKNLSCVTIPGLPDVESYAGFFTVDKTYNSNLFVWYFPPFNRGKKTLATIVWLQGGPGFSSLYGLFEENGPIAVRNNIFQKKNYSWNDNNHVVYIDNPVGTGFSFTNDSRGYCTNQTQIGEQLYVALYQLYQMFPELLDVGLVVSGESYGGKYAPSLAKTIHDNNPKAKAQGGLVLPLKGVSIGDGWCDPINQLDYADFLYQFGLIDWNCRDTAKVLADEVRELIHKEAWKPATVAWTNLITLFTYRMGYISLFDLMKGPVFECSYCDLINTVDVRKALHVGNLTFDNLNLKVSHFLQEDFMKSAAPVISELLENYNVFSYNGQQDIIEAYPLAINFLRHLNWSGSTDYEKAKRVRIVYEDSTTKVQVGFLKLTQDMRLAEAMVRKAGHMVPADQPLWTYYLVMDWVHVAVDELHESINTEDVNKLKYMYKNNSSKGMKRVPRITF